MITMRIDTLVSALVQQMLIESGGRNNEALYLHFDLQMSYYEDGIDYYAYRGLHLLYYLPVGAVESNMSVFSALSFPRVDKISETVSQWKHEHDIYDSSWRKIKVFTQTYFDMANEINKEMKRDGLPEVAPGSMFLDTGNLPVFVGQKLFDWVGVKVTTDNYIQKIELT